MASRWSRQTHVVVKVRLRAHSAKALETNLSVKESVLEDQEEEEDTVRELIFTFDFLGAVASYPLVVHLFDLLFLCCG